jgi:hypothetical protein
MSGTYEESDDSAGGETQASSPAVEPVELASPPIIPGETEAVLGGAGMPRRYQDDG